MTLLRGLSRSSFCIFSNCNLLPKIAGTRLTLWHLMLPFIIVSALFLTAPRIKCQVSDSQLSPYRLLSDESTTQDSSYMACSTTTDCHWLSSKGKRKSELKGRSDGERVLAFCGCSSSIESTDCWMHDEGSKTPILRDGVCYGYRHGRDTGTGTKPCSRSVDSRTHRPVNTRGDCAEKQICTYVADQAGGGYNSYFCFDIVGKIMKPSYQNVGKIIQKQVSKDDYVGEYSGELHTDLNNGPLQPGHAANKPNDQNISTAGWENSKGDRTASDMNGQQTDLQYAREAPPEIGNSTSSNNVEEFPTDLHDTILDDQTTDQSDSRHENGELDEDSTLGQNFGLFKTLAICGAAGFVILAVILYSIRMKAQQRADSDNCQVNSDVHYQATWEDSSSDIPTLPSPLRSGNSFSVEDSNLCTYSGDDIVPHLTCQEFQHPVANIPTQGGVFEVLERNANRSVWDRVFDFCCHWGFRTNQPCNKQDDLQAQGHPNKTHAESSKNMVFRRTLNGVWRRCRPSRRGDVDDMTVLTTRSENCFEAYGNSTTSQQAALPDRNVCRSHVDTQIQFILPPFPPNHVVDGGSSRGSREDRELKSRAGRDLQVSSNLELSERPIDTSAAQIAQIVNVTDGSRSENRLSPSFSSEGSSNNHVEILPSSYRRRLESKKSEIHTSSPSNIDAGNEHMTHPYCAGNACETLTTNVVWMDPPPTSKVLRHLEQPTAMAQRQCSVSEAVLMPARGHDGRVRVSVKKPRGTRRRRRHYARANSERLQDNQTMQSTFHNADTFASIHLETPQISGSTFTTLQPQPLYYDEYLSHWNNTQRMQRREARVIESHLMASYAPSMICCRHSDSPQVANETADQAIQHLCDHRLAGNVSSKKEKDDDKINAQFCKETEICSQTENTGACLEEVLTQTQRGDPEQTLMACQRERPTQNLRTVEVNGTQFQGRQEGHSSVQPSSQEDSVGILMSCHPSRFPSASLEVQRQQRFDAEQMIRGDEHNDENISGRLKECQDEMKGLSGQRIYSTYMTPAVLPTPMTDKFGHTSENNFRHQSQSCFEEETAAIVSSAVSTESAAEWRCSPFELQSMAPYPGRGTAPRAHSSGHGAVNNSANEFRHIRRQNQSSTRKQCLRTRRRVNRIRDQDSTSEHLTASSAEGMSGITRVARDQVNTSRHQEALFLRSPERAAEHESDNASPPIVYAYAVAVSSQVSTLPIPSRFAPYEQFELSNVEDDDAYDAAEEESIESDGHFQQCAYADPPFPAIRSTEHASAQICVLGSPPSNEPQPTNEIRSLRQEYSKTP